MKNDCGQGIKFLFLHILSCLALILNGKGGDSMEQVLTFTVIGGDRRSFFAAKRLREQGFSVELTALANEKPFCASEPILTDAVLLPLPMTRDGKHLFAPELEKEIALDDVFRSISRKSIIFAGNAQNAEDERLVDYGKRDEFAIFNAVPTAEGALLLALRNGKRTVFGMRVGVIGYGKVAFATAKLFHAVGANVTVFARKARARIEAHMMGYTARPISALFDNLNEYELLINTVPARIFDGERLSAIPTNTRIIDLASAPYGLDFDEAAKLGIRAECASGLPGRFFPETAGYAVADTVMDLLREKKILF
jgi:dipicolinate synthase subunit A